MYTRSLLIWTWNWKYIYSNFLKSKAHIFQSQHIYTNIKVNSNTTVFTHGVSPVTFSQQVVAPLYFVTSSKAFINICTPQIIIIFQRCVLTHGRAAPQSLLCIFVGERRCNCYDLSNEPACLGVLPGCVCAFLPCLSFRLDLLRKWSVLLSKRGDQ